MSTELEKNVSGCSTCPPTQNPSARLQTERGIRNAMWTLQHRTDLPRFFEQMGYKHGVEVGVDRGWFSKLLLSEWSGHLTGIDPYMSFPNCQDTYWNPMSVIQHLNRRQEMEANLTPFTNRWTHLQEASPQASASFTGSSLDFVYLDGNHDFDHVYSELYAWWGKIRPLGIFAGHDYLYEPNTIGQVRSAVSRFMREQRLVHNFTLTNGDEIPSWIILKPPAAN